VADFKGPVVAGRSSGARRGEPGTFLGSPLGPARPRATVEPGGAVGFRSRARAETAREPARQAGGVAAAGFVWEVAVPSGSDRRRGSMPGTHGSVRGLLPGIPRARPTVPPARQPQRHRLLVERRGGAPARAAAGDGFSPLSHGGFPGRWGSALARPEGPERRRAAGWRTLDRSPRPGVSASGPRTTTVLWRVSDLGPPGPGRWAGGHCRSTRGRPQRTSAYTAQWPAGYVGTASRRRNHHIRADTLRHSSGRVGFFERAANAAGSDGVGPGWEVSSRTSGQVPEGRGQGTCSAVLRTRLAPNRQSWSNGGYGFWVVAPTPNRCIRSLARRERRCGASSRSRGTTLRAGAQTAARVNALRSPPAGGPPAPC